MDSYSLQELGWQPFFSRQVLQTETICRPARVCAHFGSQLLLLSEAGELSVPTSLVQRDGDSRSIAVGDWILLEPGENRAVRHLDRMTRLLRKATGNIGKPQLIASNIDTVFVVSSCNQDFNLSRLERYLALILDSGALPVVVLTKSDLCEDSSHLRQLAESLHPGLLVEVLDARDQNQTPVLESWCSFGKTIALLGSSGVGKSTLANSLGGFDLKTGGIRQDDGKGRHTTTTRSMHRLTAGGWLIDNPGMRELQLPACEDGVAELFDDVLQLARQCRFRNCGHEGDSGCAVEAAIESGRLDRRRLINFLKLQSEQARNSASMAERRERDRKTGKMYKRIIADKKHRRRG